MSLTHRHWLGLIALLLLPILVLRFYRFALPNTPVDPAQPFATLPPGLDSDEAFHTLAALRLTQGEVTPFFKIDQGIPAAMIYGIALLLPLFGPAAELGRWVSALAGLGVLAGLPLLARKLWPTQPAIALAVLANTGFIFWFVNFSRLGLEQITCTFLIVLAFLTLTQWLRRNTWRWAAAAGCALALSLYSYPAAYVAPLAIGLALAYHYFATRTKPNWKQLVLFASVFIITVAPLAIFFYLNPDWATRRASQTAGSFNLLGTLGGLFWGGDTITRHNIPGRPLLDPIQSLLFIIGLLVCVRR
jgi:hypothetical protein